MKTICKLSIPLLLLVTSFHSLFAQQNFFSDVREKEIAIGNAKQVVTPQKFRATLLKVQKIKDFLWSLPAEKNLANRNLAPILELPMPDGKNAQFHVWESSIMEPGLAAKFPEIKTFEGQGIDDPAATIRFDYNPYFGFNAQILSPKGDIYIDPYARGNINYYTSYYTSDNKRNPVFICNTHGKPDATGNRLLKTEAACRGTQLYTYRLALACTGEYAVAVCSPNPATVPATLAAMVTSINRVDGVYETELAIRMVLVANNSSLVYLDGSTDPYTNSNGITMLVQNQSNIDAVIGASNYDFGHVFSTGGGGIAQLGVICVNGSKAEGVTGLSNPVGDNFDIDYVAHEMGHEFGANHPFNSSAGNCGGGNINPTTAYEVGSGTTIMAYAGICSTDNIQPHSDPFFHGISFDEISDYIAGTGGTCATVTSTGNNIPVITAMNNNGANIPLNTPFTLTATAIDPDGDPITYCWEEWDLGPSTTWNDGNSNTTSPLFKSRRPVTSGSRTFPDMSLILANYTLSTSDLNGLVMDGNKGETLPAVARTMNFKLTVRDNRAGGGGVTSGGSGGCQSGFTAPFQIHTVGGTGPFVVTVPNGGETWTGTSSQTITWNVAGTNASPINTSNVKISLSTDGGLTYPTVLAASTPNDGSEALAIPNTPTNTARIKIEAIGNIFFDISNADFTISPPGAPSITTQPQNITLCAGSNNTFSIAANGLNLAYQWQLSTNGGTNFSDIAGANTSTYTVNSITIGMNNYEYRCVISGSIAPAATSAAAVLTVIAPVTVNSQPSNVSVCPVGQLNSGNTNFTVSGNSTQPINYQWQVNTGSGFANIANDGVYSNATTATLNITGATPTMNNYQYQCLLSNAACTTPTISSAATLTVYPLPTVSLSASPFTKLFPGLISTLTAIPVPSSGVTLAWYKNGVFLPGVTSTTFAADVTGLGIYQVTITDANGCMNQSQVVTISDSISNKLFIYPSPNLGQFTVSYYNPGGAGTQQNVTIYDSRGARVYNGKFAVAGPYQLISINMKIPARGIYYVVLGDPSGKKLAEGKMLVQ